jgi:DNA-directed RNA polymerase specialized sigma24 family protein
MTTTTPPDQPTPARRKPRMTIEKPASKNPVWDELETLMRQYRELPPNPQTPPDSTPQAEDPQRVRLRLRIWQLLAGTWVSMAAAEVREEPDNETYTGEHTDTQPGDTPSQLLRRDSALEQLFRIKAHKLAHKHGDELIKAYGGPTNLAANGQQAFFIEKMARMAEKRRFTVLSSLAHEWNPETAKLETYLGRAVENFIRDLARSLKARKGKKRYGLDAQLPELQVSSSADEDDKNDDKNDGKNGPDLENRPAELDHEMSLQEREQELTEARERFAAVQQAVNALPEKQRRVFEAWFAQQDDDLTDEQAAAIAGLERKSYTIQRNKLMKMLREQSEAFE